MPWGRNTATLWGVCAEVRGWTGCRVRPPDDGTLDPWLLEDVESRPPTVLI